MAISRVDENTEIKVGQWVCPSSIHNHGICGIPRHVTKVHKTQIHFIAGDGNDSKARYYMRPSVVYVCDTKEEAAQLYAISQRCVEESEKALKEIRGKHLNEVKALLA